MASRRRRTTIVDDLIGLVKWVAAGAVVGAIVGASVGWLVVHTTLSAAHALAILGSIVLATWAAWAAREAAKKDN